MMPTTLLGSRQSLWSTNSFKANLSFLILLKRFMSVIHRVSPADCNAVSRPLFIDLWRCWSSHNICFDLDSVVATIFASSYILLKKSIRKASLRKRLRLWASQSTVITWRRSLSPFIMLKIANWVEQVSKIRLLTLLRLSLLISSNFCFINCADLVAPSSVPSFASVRMTHELVAVTKARLVMPRCRPSVEPSELKLRYVVFLIMSSIGAFVLSYAISRSLLRIVVIDGNLMARFKARSNAFVAGVCTSSNGLLSR